ncbi:helix-turn-helix domain-containing protein [Planctomicrobium sp. SH664]|uniref:helix-turn-helix domain-containing protein n=1 Tax=Planctomicrobium sp. SH664 TaxID=3448125 RepID=UPI003F5BFDEE
MGNARNNAKQRSGTPETTSMVESLLWRVSQVARRLNCSVSTVYSLIESGRLEHHRCPGIRISEEQILAYLEQTKQGRTPRKTKQARINGPRLRHITLK